MSVKVMSHVWDVALPPGEKLVLLKLADCADDLGGNAFPSVGSLVAACGMGHRTVQRTLRTLVDGGHVVVDLEATNRRPTTYRVVVPWGAKLAPQEVLGVPSTTSRGANRDTLGVPSTTDMMIRHVQEQPSGPDVQALPGLPPPVTGATPDLVAATWNEATTPPFAGIRALSPDRRAKLARACRAVPSIDDWRRLFMWMNSQTWMRAKGTGPHANWIATLDWLVETDRRVLGYVERATTAKVARVAPRTAKGVADATRAANVGDVAGGDLDLFTGGEA